MIRAPGLRVFNYFDYRAFLRDYLETMKRIRSSFSLAVLSRRAPGFSKTHLSLIAHGKRNIASSKIECLGRALNLETEGLRYFHHLVRFNQAKTVEERELFLEQLVSARPRREGRNLFLDEYLALRNWQCLALRELIKLPDFNPEPVAISRRFRGRMSPAEAKQAIDLLLHTGLATLDETGALKVGSETLRTTDEVSSKTIQSYHKTCLDLGKTVLDEENVECREFSSVNVTLTQEEFRWLKSRLKKIRDEAAEAEGGGQGRKQLYQLNVQLFALAD